MELWDSAQKRNVPPTTERIKRSQRSVGYKNVLFSPQNRTVFFRKPGMKIDLGGIGKGYAVDRAVDIFKKNKIQEAFVDAGGNIFCLDKYYSPIGIKNPFNPDEITATVLLKNKAISTSANYERCFSIRGKKYGHLINPKTGVPADNGILSVSVISSSATIADILSTAVFILGLEEGMELIEKMGGVEGVIIIKKGRRLKLQTTSGLKEVSHLIYLPN